MARNSSPAKTKEEVVEEKPELLFGQPIVDLSEEEIDDLSAEEDSFDIFIDVGDKLRRNGDAVTYTIKKDGAFLAGSIKHPYSWDRIHKKWGGGTFTVVARSAKKNGFIKQQSRFLSDETVEDEATSPAVGSTANSPVEMLALLQSMKADERQEARDREERADQARREREERLEKENERRLLDQKETGNSMMQMMTMMMKAQSDNTTAMMAAMMGSRENEMRPEKLVELMDSRMEKMVDRLTGGKNKNEMNPLQLVTEMATAEERGYRKAMEMVELAEKKAEELAELRGNGAPAGKEEPSTTKVLMDAVMPMAQAFLAAKMAGGPTPPAQPPQVNLPGRAPALQNRPQQPKALGTPQSRAPQPLQQRPITVKSTPIQVPNPIQTKPQTSGFISTPSAQAPAKPVANVVTTNPPIQEEISEMSRKQLIEKIVIDEITKDIVPNLISQKFNPDGTAERCLKLLEAFKVSPGVLCSQFTLNDMISVARARGMPEAIIPYLEKFYAYVAAKARVDDRISPPSS